VAGVLVLIRHAKAVHDGGADVARELSPRGFRDATAVGQWLVAHDLVPDLVVVSPAARTRQTWEAIQAELTGQPETITDERVYENTVEALLAAVREGGGGARTVAVVGHNPSMQAFALDLDDSGSEVHVEVAEAYPTSGVAILDVPVGWAELAAGGAVLREFATPRG
jgi:phosphohistidine phosphatase